MPEDPAAIDPRRKAAYNVGYESFDPFDRKSIQVKLLRTAQGTRRLAACRADEKQRSQAIGRACCAGLRRIWLFALRHDRRRNDARPRYGIRRFYAMSVPGSAGKGLDTFFGGMALETAITAGNGASEGNRQAKSGRRGPETGSRTGNSFPSIGSGWKEIRA